MILLLSLILGCGSAPSEAATVAAPTTGAHAAAEKARDMDVTALDARLDGGGIFVLDVRTPREFSQGHVPGALNISLQDLPGRLSEIESHKGEDFAVICAVGGRSAAATALLRDQGYAGATNVTGGTRAWAQAGHPLE